MSENVTPAQKPNAGPTNRVSETEGYLSGSLMVNRDKHHSVRDELRRAAQIFGRIGGQSETWATNMPANNHVMDADKRRWPA